MIVGTVESEATGYAHEYATEVRVTLRIEGVPQGLNYYMKMYHLGQTESGGSPDDPVQMHQMNQMVFRHMTTTSGTILEIFVGQDAEPDPFAYGFCLVLHDRVAALEEEIGY